MVPFYQETVWLSVETCSNVTSWSSDLLVTFLQQQHTQPLIDPSNVDPERKHYYRSVRNCPGSYRCKATGRYSAVYEIKQLLSKLFCINDCVHFIWPDGVIKRTDELSWHIRGVCVCVCVKSNHWNLHRAGKKSPDFYTYLLNVNEGSAR